VYKNTGVTEVDKVTGSIYSADPRVDRHYLISISSYYTMKLHILCFPTFGLTHCVRDVVDSYCQVVSYLLTGFLRFPNQNCSFSGILFGFRERVGRVLRVGSLPSSSIILPQWPPSSASLSSLNERIQVLIRLCSTTICSPIEHMYICGVLNDPCHIML